jgi:hypothetical protein
MQRVLFTIGFQVLTFAMVVDVISFNRGQKPNHELTQINTNENRKTPLFITDKNDVLFQLMKENEGKA